MTAPKLVRHKGRGCTYSLTLPMKAILNGEVLKKFGHRFPKGLVKAIQAASGGWNVILAPTHRVKKDDKVFGLKVGDLFHVPDRQWRRTRWVYCSSNNTVTFQKVRGHWFQGCMVHVDIEGVMVGPAETSRYEVPLKRRNSWFSEHLERIPLRRKKAS